jgi:hypothetical protein
MKKRAEPQHADPAQAIGARKSGDNPASPLPRTGSSNPLPSSGESAANLAPSIRCRWPPLPSHFSLLSPIAAPAPASAEAPNQAATMVTHYRKATIDGVSIFYREAGPAMDPSSCCCSPQARIAVNPAGIVRNEGLLSLPPAASRRREPGKTPRGSDAKPR